MPDDASAPAHDPVTMDLRAEAHRLVRKQRILHTILGFYAVLTLMWFASDTADGTESLRFYWPMLGTGLIVAITSVVLVGMGGVSGTGWRQRQIDHHVRQRGRRDGLERGHPSLLRTRVSSTATTSGSGERGRSSPSSCRS
jgi:hypothetical protein